MTDSIVLTVVVAGIDNPIRGTVKAAGGLERPFLGWIDLAAALEAVLAAAPGAEDREMGV